MAQADRRQTVLRKNSGFPPEVIGTIMTRIMLAAQRLDTKETYGALLCRFHEHVSGCILVDEPLELHHS